MKEFEPVIKEVSFERATLTDVKRVKSGYEISHGAWTFWLQDQNNKDKIQPKIGDVVIFYGKGMGYEVQGIQINQHLLYYVTDEEVEAKRRKWIADSQIKDKQEYDALMLRIKDEEPFETVNISGFGSGYERACQLALRAGIKWLEAHPDFKFNVKTYKGVYGIAELVTAGVKEYEDLAKELDKVMMDAVDNDMTGAMHQAIISHLKYIHENSIKKWLNEAKTTYTYPTELPTPYISSKNCSVNRVSTASPRSRRPGEEDKSPPQGDR